MRPRPRERSDTSVKKQKKKEEKKEEKKKKNLFAKLANSVTDVRLG